jgi:pimeloyl-ACP methyl ester carboxylesterase
MTLITLPRSKSQSGLAYVKSGQGPSLVLIHGVGLRLEAWMHQIETLSDYFTVYAVDMPGHGESALMPQCRDIPSYTDAIADWIRDEVKTPVLIAGHSMGSMIALNFAIRFPELCVGVVALNSVYRRSDDAKRAVIDRVQQIKESITPDNVTAPVKRWFDFPLVGDDAQHALWCQEWLSQASLDGYRQAYEVFCFNDGPCDSDLSQLNLPALFLTGEGDPNSTPAMSMAMAERCPKGQSYVVKQARHMAPLTHATEINPIIKEFGQSAFGQQEGGFL